MNDPTARAKHARELVRQGSYDEALAEFLWCFDHGVEAMPTYVGVRTSFLLGDLVRLAEMHPPALAALESRRDAAEARLLAGTYSRVDFSTFGAINARFGAHDRNLALYDRLEKNTSNISFFRSSAFARSVVPLLTKAKRYSEAVALVDDPEAHVERAIELALHIHRVRPSRGTDASAQQSADDRLVREHSVLYEALLGAGRMDEAARIAERLTAFLPFGFAYAELIRSAGRAGAIDAARALAERGLASLPTSEHDAVRSALAALDRAK